MTGKKERDTPWHHTTVILRSDIYRQAVGRGIDISDACNRALAEMTGCEYHGQQLDKVPALPAVIVAGNGSLPHNPGETGTTAQKVHPVINADDPAAPARVVQAKARPVKKAPAVPVKPASAPAPVTPEDQQHAAPAISAGNAAGRKGKAATAKRRSRGDALRTFFLKKVTRSDDPGAVIAKDELYDLFTRFCREHHITQVPERRAVTVALKNQFALMEKNVNGAACWTGIRIQ